MCTFNLLIILLHDLHFTQLGGGNSRISKECYTGPDG